MTERLAIEVLDPFGTVVASGEIPVDQVALRPAELAGAQVRPSGKGWLARMPMLLVNLEGHYTKTEPVNPRLAWQVMVRLVT